MRFLKTASGLAIIPCILLMAAIGVLIAAFSLVILPFFICADLWRQRIWATQWAHKPSKPDLKVV